MSSLFASCITSLVQCALKESRTSAQGSFIHAFVVLVGQNSVAPLALNFSQNFSVKPLAQRIKGYVRFLEHVPIAVNASFSLTSE